MSSPATILSGVLEGRLAKFFRRAFVAASIYGISGDYYLMKHYELFPKEEATEFVVDFSPIGLPGPTVYNLPDLLYQNFTPWAPRNGDVVLGRISPAHPQFVQLIGGRFVERESCGVELLVPKERYEEVVRLRKDEDRRIPQGQDALLGVAIEANNRTQLPDRR